MIYAALFACALAIGWFLAWRKGGSAEMRTMCILTCVWIGTVVANCATQSPAPVLFYALLDVFAIGWLLSHQQRNWQWMPAGLFAAMLLTHFVFWSGTSGGLIIYESRPYQDILAILGYAQIFCVGWASHERARERLGEPSRMGRWGLSVNWVPVRRMGHKHHAGTG